MKLSTSGLGQQDHEGNPILKFPHILLLFIIFLISMFNFSQISIIAIVVVIVIAF